MALRICIVVLCLFSVSSWGHFDNYNEDDTDSQDIAVSPPFLPTRSCQCECSGGTNPHSITHHGTADPTEELNAAIIEAIEFFLNQVKVSINAAASQSISLPNVELSVGAGSVKCTGGYFKGFQSISLAGGIKVTKRGAGFVIDFPVELKETEIGFKYAVSILGAGPKGSFKGSLGANRFNIRLSMSVGQPCLVNLEKVETVQLSGLKVRLTTGCTTCDKVINQATNVINNLLPASIKVPLQVQIFNFFSKVVPGKGFACAQYIVEGSINKK